MESIGDLRAEFPSSIHNDLVSFIQWELFLSVVSVYIYIEDFAGINKFLHRTYYMYVRGQSKNSYNYRYFHDSCRSLDEYYKLHDLGNKYSAMADTLMNRTNASILTKARLISADMLVYHLYPFVFTDKNYWFPLTYIYQTKSIVLSLPWPKLESKDQYNRIAPLLGGITLDEFKSRMNYPYNFTMGYNEVMFNYALWITDYIDPNAVGSRD